MTIRKCDINLTGPNWIESSKNYKEGKISVYRGEELLETISLNKLDGYLRICKNCEFAIREELRMHFSVWLILILHKWRIRINIIPVKVLAIQRLV